MRYLPLNAGNAAHTHEEKEAYDTKNDEGCSAARYGDVSRLSYEDAAMPLPEAGEVLVKTIAVSINPIDWKLRRRDLREMMPLEFPAILGRDISGTVVALGEGVSGLKVFQLPTTPASMIDGVDRSYSASSQVLTL